MSAKSIAIPVSNLPRAGARLSRRSTRPLWIVSLLVIAAIAAVASKALAAGSTASSNVLTPGLQLATGTLDLEGTAQAVDATQAAKLLPLWELLAQLNSSGSAAPEEITAVIQEIKLNMSAAQISAIDAMPASDFNLGAAGSSSAASGTSASSKTASSAASDPMLSGAMGAAPMDGGGGPMPSGSSQSTSSSKTTTTVSGPIQQVVELLKTKVQN